MKNLVLLSFCALAAGVATQPSSYPAATQAITTNLTASDIVNLTAYAASLKAH